MIMKTEKTKEARNNLKQEWLNPFKTRLSLSVFGCCFLILLFFFGCNKKSEHAEHTSSEAKRYELRGKVISVDKNNKKAEIEHEEIPGFMPKMTMTLPIHDDWVWEDLVPGVEIKADLVVDEKAKEPYWLENLVIVATRVGNLPPPPPVNESFGNVGKEVPNFQLTNQDGKKISIKDFKGKALAITFIYTRCPLADYCIRMSTNFSDLNARLVNSEYRDKIRLLTISFDPEHDTPEKLRQYGLGYMGKDAKPDFTVWQLAVAPDKKTREIADFFGLRYEVDQNDKTQINHSLVTAVIAPDGKIRKIFKGNSWTVDQLEKELVQSLNGASEN
jgi:protein SCO1/2